MANFMKIWLFLLKILPTDSEGGVFLVYFLSCFRHLVVHVFVISVLGCHVCFFCMCLACFHIFLSFFVVFSSGAGAGPGADLESPKTSFCRHMSLFSLFFACVVFFCMFLHFPDWGSFLCMFWHVLNQNDKKCKKKQHY